MIRRLLITVVIITLCGRIWSAEPVIMQDGSEVDIGVNFGVTYDYQIGVEVAVPIVIGTVGAWDSVEGLMVRPFAGMNGGGIDIGYGGSVNVSSGPYGLGMMGWSTSVSYLRGWNDNNDLEAHGDYCGIRGRFLMLGAVSAGLFTSLDGRDSFATVGFGIGL